MLKSVFSLLLLLSPLSALPVGNPQYPSMHYYGVYFSRDCFMQTYCDPMIAWWYAFNFRLGMESDFVWDRQMEGRGQKIERFALSANAVTLTLNAFDQYDFFLQLGQSQMRLHTKGEVFAAVDRIKMESENDFSWTLGGRGIVWQCRSLCLGVEGRYFQFHPNFKKITLGDAIAIYNDGDGIRYQETQLSLALSYRMNVLIPYIALKGSHARIRFVESDVLPVTLFKLVSRNHLGFSLGVSLLSCYRFSLTSEIRLCDEKAFDIQAQIRF